MEEFEKQRLIKEINSGLEEAKEIIIRHISVSKKPKWYYEELPKGGRKIGIKNGKKVLAEIIIHD